jgi:alpha-ketoglutarate-dependent taurine dioxygenase
MVVGMDAQESDAVLDVLTGCTILPDGDYRHKWRVGDIVIWDNQSSCHRAAERRMVTE